MTYGKARIGKGATSGGLVGTILTASGTGVGHLTTGSSLGMRGGTNGPGDAKLLEAFLCHSQPLSASATTPCSQWLLAHLLQPHGPTDLAITGWHSLVDDDEGKRYLKGGRSGPKGNFHFKGVDKGPGKGIGKGT